MNEKITFTSRDLKEIKSLTLDDIATVLFAAVDYHETNKGHYVDEYGTLIARDIYELGETKAYTLFAREIRKWAELSLVYKAPARIDAAIKPYLKKFLAYYKRLSETAA